MQTLMGSRAKTCAFAVCGVVGMLIPAMQPLRADELASFPRILLLGGKTAGKADKRAAESAQPEILEAGSSSATARKAALAALPLNQLRPDQRAKANSILGSISFYRRLPKVSFPVEPEVYNYFVAHPDVTASLWRAMNISKLEMWQTARYEYEADLKDGTLGVVEALLQSPDRQLVFCDGSFKSPLLTKPIKARSLLLLETTLEKHADGRATATHRAELFVSFPSETVEAISKVLTPVTTTITDKTFSEVSLFLKLMSRAMASRPDWVEDLVQKMDGVTDIRKKQVRELSDHVHTTSRQRAVVSALQTEAAELSKEREPMADVILPVVSDNPRLVPPTTDAKPVRR